MLEPSLPAAATKVIPAASTARALSLNASLGPGSPTRFKTGDYEFQQALANFDISRGFDAGDHHHTVATGVEFRREEYDTGAGDPAVCDEPSPVCTGNLVAAVLAARTIFG